jgi:flagellar biosynthesis protein FliR
MIQVGSEMLDYLPLWTFLLLLTRFSGLLLVLPGVGTDYVSPPFRFYTAIAIAFVISLTGVQAVEAKHTAEAILMLSSEFLLGFAIGAVPSFILGGLAVGGTLVSGAIGLGQANMIDRSLGVPVALISKIQVLVATVVFLTLDGHHMILRAASGIPGELGLGMLQNAPETAQVFQECLVNSFHLAVMVSAPILVTTLITQFILGLITKFIPQVNIFIVSLPLGLLVGFYIMEYSLAGLINEVVREFGAMDEYLIRLMPLQ